MSDRIELTTPPAPVELRPALEQLRPAALVHLATGFSCAFWGLLVLIVALTESLVSNFVRPLSVILLLAGGAALVTGAWRLQRVTGLGRAWHNRTRALAGVTVLVAYLSLFYLLWRQVPSNLYLLAHTLAFFASVLAALCLLSLPIVTLARAAARSGLATQAGAFGTAALVILAPPWGILALKMVEAAQQNINPFALLQLWIVSNDPWLTMILLVPVSLTLSLLWSAKDLALDQLAASPES